MKISEHQLKNLVNKVNPIGKRVELRNLNNEIIEIYNKFIAKYNTLIQNKQENALLETYLYIKKSENFCLIETSDYITNDMTLEEAMRLLFKTSYKPYLHGEIENILDTLFNN